MRRQLESHTAKLDPSDDEQLRTATQLQILNDYGLAVQTVLNLDALQPLQYGSPAVDDALEAIATSLDKLEKRD